MAGELEHLNAASRTAVEARRDTPELRPIPRRLAYPAAGVALSIGAPAGLLLLRSMLRAAPFTAELSQEWPTYLYVGLSTATVFAVLGRRLGRQADRLAEQSLTDPLTGLNNARVLQGRLPEELGRSARYQQPLSLLLLDLDRLKSINDHGGHAAGDRALRWVAKAVRSQMRTTDIGARWGGDEFALLAPNTSMRAAVAVAERLRANVARTHNGNRCTVSIGVASFEPAPGMTPPDPAHFMARADSALYEAKRRGRNRVVTAARMGHEEVARTDTGEEAP